MRVPIASIAWDTSIQCRSSIDMEVVNDYAEKMAAGAEFPPVVLFGTKEKCWIADGWHRISAAKQLDESAIDADLRPGTRIDALKYALGANAANGLRRSNLDKRRAVEIALREFGNLSSRAIAELCGVGHELVDAARPLADSANATRTTSDGRQYPAHRQRPESEPAHQPDPAPRDRPSDPTEAGRQRVSEIDMDEDALITATLKRLKQLWREASSAERRAFTEWINGGKR